MTSVYVLPTARPPRPETAYAKRLVQQFARETPESVTAVMAKKARAGRVFID
ncbi:hypothetical protein AB0M80_39390 [Amycolatopsis sp. NPDC051045]|uniref:non-homologous end-joining DNA ligase LigD n=1 Tax=Amycolatopsis sp. NPDC051045 TaxID=3156922 RepID=UPI0034290583